ncbi:hypothetical protein ASD50_19490 [Mesorhizobium sp. Root552]|uniref:AAA family ATPase n=1 Tax=Mesorhizobium sp. Root552 TaxID=1736555 RepID=UPI0006F91E2D|nr:AAA family ATPase [Mesorhizobium sp. Root552]KQZ28665.1 hypothetical protein ASD50_19490 [Mesorhizobium sp. Root552]
MQPSGSKDCGQCGAHTDPKTDTPQTEAGPPTAVGEQKAADHKSIPKSLSPIDFLFEIYGSNVSDIWVCSFPPGPEHWPGRWFGANGAAYVQPSNNNYFCIGLLGPNETRRSSAGVVKHFLFFADDIGTKVDPAKWEALFAQGFPRPTYKIETSPGNQTWVWVLDKPVSSNDAARVRSLRVVREALGRLGLSDPLPDDARYIRMPCGINSKQKYMEEYGMPVPVRLVEHNPAARADLDHCAALLLGPDWRDKSDEDLGLKPSGSSMAGALDRTADLNQPEPIMQLAQALGTDLSQVRAGVVEALCPNIDAHTTRADTGFAFLGNGLMECSHASCQHLRTPDFQRMMCERFDNEQDGREALGLPLLPGGRTASEFLARAAFDYHDAKIGITADAIQQAADRIAAGQVGALTGIPVAFRPTQFRLQASTRIPPREWVYGRHLIRGHVSLLVSPGGLGKSSLVIAEALAMVTGKPLLGENPTGQLRVWLWNGEDPIDELDRRITGTCVHYGITSADIGDRLMVDSGRNLPIKIVRAGQDGQFIAKPAVDALADILKAAKVDVLIIDPFVTTHDLPENDNTAMNAVAAAWRQVADRAGCSVLLVHHVSKAGALDGDALGIYGARGAGSLIDAVRSARFLVRMTKEEAEKFGVFAPDDPRRYFRVQTGKSNLAPPGDAQWLRTVGVPLHNGTAQYPDGDVVGVVETWTPPSIANTTTVQDLQRVQDAIRAATDLPRENEQALDWVGYLIADAVGLDVGVVGSHKPDRTPAQNAARAHVRQLLSVWVANGGLVRTPVPGQAGKRQVYVIDVGKPAQTFMADNNNELPAALRPEGMSDNDADAA